MWLQTQLPLQKAEFVSQKEPHFVSSCHKIGDSKVLKEGEGMKLCAKGIGWNCDNEGSVRPLGEKDYSVLNAEQIVYISFIIITCYFLCYECFVYASLIFLPFEPEVSSEVSSDGDLLWLLSCGW